MKKLWMTLFLVVFCSAAFSETLNDKLRALTEEVKSVSYDRNQNQKILENDARILSLLKERQSLINELLEKNPGQVASLLLTSDMLQTFSKKEQRYLEKSVLNLSGILEIRAAIGRFSEFEQYVLITPNETYYLHFSGKVNSKLKTGMKITVSEAYVIPRMRGSHHVLLDSANIRIDTQAKNTVVQDAFGPQNTVVLLVNFQDAPTNKPWTVAAIQDMVFNSVNNVYKDFSYNQTSIIGKVYGFYTIALNSTSTCDTITNKVPELADAAAVKAGVSLSQYMRRVYIFPTTKSCRWAGLGTVGRSGSYSKSWINGYVDYYYLAHEIGHNLTLRHSHALKCSNGTSNQGSCSSIEYGDVVDTMGEAHGHFNAFQKEILGWLGYNNSPPMTTVTTNGTYNIEPYETATKNPKALKILKSVATDGSKNHYYIEFRQPIGYDARLSSSCPTCDVFQGVVIHQGNSNDNKTSFLLDMTPADNNFNHMVLLPGMTFTDSTADNGGVTITANSISSSGAAVSVAFGNQSNCVRNPPMVNYDPYQPQTVSRGQVTTITVSIINNDSENCPDSIFNITSVPENSSLVTNVPNNNLVAKPNGGRVIATVEITPSSTAPTGVPLFATTTIRDTVVDRPQWFTTQITVQN